jgi:hypothetical protein
VLMAADSGSIAGQVDKMRGKDFCSRTSHILIVLSFLRYLHC